MYTYQVFTATTDDIQGINHLLTHLCSDGWEPVEIYWDRAAVLAKKSKALLD